MYGKTYTGQFIYVLFSKQAFQTAQGVAQLVHVDLGLDELRNGHDLIVGQVDFQQLLHGGNGILLELGGDVLVGGMDV